MLAVLILASSIHINLTLPEVRSDRKVPVCGLSSTFMVFPVKEPTTITFCGTDYESLPWEPLELVNECGPRNRKATTYRVGDREHQLVTSDPDPIWGSVTVNVPTREYALPRVQRKKKVLLP